MSAQTMLIGNRPCRIYGEAHAEYLLLQMTGEHELQSMDDEVAAIAQSDRKYLFAAIPVESWNDALSPWKSPAVWGKQGFGGLHRVLLFKLHPTREPHRGGGGGDAIKQISLGG